MKQFILSIILLFCFTVTPFAQPTDLEKALENALTDCRTDYYSLSKRYHTLDSAMERSSIELRSQLRVAEAATKEAEKNSKIAIEKQEKRKLKSNILYGIFGGIVGIVFGANI